MIVVPGLSAALKHGAIKSTALIELTDSLGVVRRYNTGPASAAYKAQNYVPFDELANLQLPVLSGSLDRQQAILQIASSMDIENALTSGNPGAVSIKVFLTLGSADPLLYFTGGLGEMQIVDDGQIHLTFYGNLGRANASRGVQNTDASQRRFDVQDNSLSFADSGLSVVWGDFPEERIEVNSQNPRNPAIRQYLSMSNIRAYSWFIGTAVSVTLPAARPNTGNPSITYRLTGLPSGLSFNSSTRQITGTPTAEKSGTLAYSASASGYQTVSRNIGYVSAPTPIPKFPVPRISTRNEKKKRILFTVSAVTRQVNGSPITPLYYQIEATNGGSNPVRRFRAQAGVLYHISSAGLGGTFEGVVIVRVRAISRDQSVVQNSEWSSWKSQAT